jgi:hypothetical protein
LQAHPTEVQKMQCSVLDRCRKRFWIFFLLICSFRCTSVASIEILLDDSYSYNVVDSENHTLFQGGDIAVFMEGRWCVANSMESDSSSWKAPRELIRRTKDFIRGRVSGLGSYRGVKIEWDCLLSDDDTGEAIPVVTTFKNFESGLAILFEVEWPDGADNTTVPSPEGSLANFPIFVQSSSQNNPYSLPSVLSWQGSFVQSVRGYSMGPKGGPTVFYNSSDPNLSTVIVASPFGGNWKAFTAGNNQDWKGSSAFSPGTSGRISSLPKDFKQSFLLHQAKHGGISSALAEWGAGMKRSRPSKGRKIQDITLRQVGYQTDNGAMYCFCSEKNCSEILISEVRSLNASGIPIGYLSFQSAGASSGRGKAAPWCVEVWGVDGGLDRQHYPMDLVSFQQALSVPLQLYAPYFCPSTIYFGNTTNGNWKSVSSDPTLPGCEAFSFKNINALEALDFYGWFYDKGLNAGMVSFETDFMNQNFNCVPDFIKSATHADQWLLGMADAALTRNVSIQWCYATPTDVLASIDLPAVTNFRVSFDFCYGKSWDIGESSLLVWALGAAPSKDTLWTTDNNRASVPGCPWTPDHETPAAELHLVLSLMTTGPVGISDTIGMTNATLLKRAIRSDGTLLKPMKAITAVDSTFVDSSGGGRNGKDGYLYGTSGRGKSWIFVSFKMKESYPVTLEDFWPPVASSATLLAYRHFSDGRGCLNGTDAVASGCVRLVSIDKCRSRQSVFEAPVSPNGSPGSDFSPCVTSVWQACASSGWFFLGELRGYVSLSPARFIKVSCTASGVTATLVGSAGEIVELTALKPTHEVRRHSGFEVVLRKVVFPKSQVLTVSFGELHEVNARDTRLSDDIQFS